MRLLKVEPIIYRYINFGEFCEEFRIGKDDLIITNKNIYYEFLKDNIKESAIILKENYGLGFSSYNMVESIYESVKKISYERVIAIGNADILQIGKIFSLRNIYPVEDLFDKKIEIAKEKELVLVPAVLGYTSEMTNICTLKWNSENDIKKLIEDELYADSTILIPQLLNLLSFKSFVSGSANIFIQAAEFYVSPKSTDYMRLFAEKSMRILLKGYEKLISEGSKYYKSLFEDFLMASNYINTICANENQDLPTYDLSQGVYTYEYISKLIKNIFSTDYDRNILTFNQLISSILECSVEESYRTLDGIIKKVMCELSNDYSEFNEKYIDNLEIDKKG